MTISKAPRPDVVEKVAEVVGAAYDLLDGGSPRAGAVEQLVATEIDGPVAWVEILDGWNAAHRARETAVTR